MNDNIYSISFSNLVAFLLPIEKRHLKRYRFLLALLSPLISLHVKFNVWRIKMVYNLQHTGQVIYLEKVLNEVFNVVGYDPTDHEDTKGIFISDGEAPDRVYIYLSDEETPLYISGTEPVWLRTEEEHAASYSDFIINVPQGVSFDELMMKAVVDYFKLAGKKYKIVIV